jgi:hypothetical protein
VLEGQLVVEVERAGHNTEAAKVARILETAGHKPHTHQKQALYVQYQSRLLLSQNHHKLPEMVLHWVFVQEFYQQNCLPLSYINANPHEPIQVNPEELSFARSLANAHPRLDKSAMKNQLKRFLVDDDDVGMTEENVSKKANRFAVD